MKKEEEEELGRHKEEEEGKGVILQWSLFLQPSLPLGVSPSLQVTRKRSLAQIS